MAFKMKAGPGGPMRKNFPGAFKAVEGEEEKQDGTQKTDVDPNAPKQPSYLATTKSGTKAGRGIERSMGNSYEYKGEYYATKAEWRAAIKADKQK